MVWRPDRRRRAFSHRRRRCRGTRLSWGYAAHGGTVAVVADRPARVADACRAGSSAVTRPSLTEPCSVARVFVSEHSCGMGRLAITIRNVPDHMKSLVGEGIKRVEISEICIARIG